MSVILFSNLTSKSACCSFLHPEWLFYFFFFLQCHLQLYARYLCSRAHSAKRARDDRVSCIQHLQVLSGSKIIIKSCTTVSKQHSVLSTSIYYIGRFPNRQCPRYPIVARALGLAAECAREQRYLASKFCAKNNR